MPDYNRSPTPLVNPLKKFIIITNAKCGGTSIKQWFISTLNSDVNPIFLKIEHKLTFMLLYITRHSFIWGIKTNSSKEQKIRRYIDYYRQYFSRHHLATAVSDDYYTVAVIRNPYQRVVSAFIDKFCTDELAKPWVQNVIQSTGNKNQAISFIEFLHYLKSSKDKDLDPHWRRQSYILESFTIDQYIKIEEMDAGFNILAKKIRVDSLNSKQEKKLQSNTYNKASNNGLCFSLISNQELIQYKNNNGTFPSKEQLLTQESIELINTIYADDFTMLPYDLRSV